MKGKEKGTPPITEEKGISYEKYVTDQKDGTYDLTLTVSGAIGSQTNPIPMDVLLIVDKSGSMKNKMDSDAAGSSSLENRRIDAVSEAVEELTTVLKDNKNLDTRYSVVTFSGPTDFWTEGKAGNAQTLVDWTGNISTVTNAIERISPNGGTNYEAGIAKGKTQLSSSRLSAQKVVIFLTDGMPTTRNGATSCEEDETDDIRKNNNAAVDEIRTMNANAFYCIGAGPGFSNATSLAVNNLKELCNNVNAEQTGVYTATNTEDLKEVFRKIAAESTSILCDHVEIEDTLSEYAQAVMNGNSPKTLKVTVLDGENRIVKEGNGSVVLDKTDLNGVATITASYDREGKKLKLSFPENYKLEPNYTYQVTISIEATDMAYQAYQQSGYLHKGESGTGVTSAGKDGFHSNEGAKVTYRYNDETDTKTYKHPVIQLPDSHITIQKKLEGLENLTADQLQELKKQLQFEVILDNTGNGQKISLSEFAFDQQTGLYSYTIPGVAIGSRYSITETNAEVTDYEYETKIEVNGKETGIAEGNVTKKGGEVICFTNSYELSNRTLTIKKTVTGNMGDTDQEFAFTLALEKDGVPYTEDLKTAEGGTLEAGTNGTYSFSLKHEGTISLSIPAGMTYTITEADSGYETSYRIGTGAFTTGYSTGKRTLDNDTTVTFKNEREVAPPTGLRDNVIPFSMMLLTAAAGTVWFGLTGRRKRSA